MGRDVVLFDRHAGGHHLEHAARLGAELAALDDDRSVTFLAPTRTDAHDRVVGFESVDVVFLDDVAGEQTPAGSDGAAAGWSATRELEAAMAYADRQADLLHLLQVDDVAGECYAAAAGRQARVPTVATLNGAFFRHSKAVERVRSVLEWPGVGPALRNGYDLGPGRVNPRLHSLARRTVGLDALVRTAAVDHLFVHSLEARRFLADIDPTASATVVPDPTDSWFDRDGWDPERRAARVELGIPDTDPVALFFGQLRDDKGVGLLVEAVAGYDGPPLTLVVAGPPDDFGRGDLSPVAANPAVTLHDAVGFVPDESVAVYFRAADAVVCPYPRAFGRQRTSNVFQKACAAARPVVAPDFGTLGRLTREFDLGAVFEPASAGALANALVSVAREDLSFDPASVREYARRQTFERAATLVDATYRAVLDGERRNVHR